MSEADQSGAGRREVAYRLFAAEFDDADFSYSESDEDRAPNYVITPTGARANRLFVVGVLTEVETVSDDVLRARVVDPTGAFVLYAGQYQPDEQAFLESAEVPMFVAVTGKARTFQPEDSDRTFTSIRPESISEVDAETRDRWTIQAAKQTVERIGWMARAMDGDATGEALRAALVEEGADDGLAHGISLALDHYGTTPAYLDAMREMALDAAEVVAGERDEVEPPTVDPDAAGDVAVGALVEATAGVLAGAESAVSASAVEQSTGEQAQSEATQPTAESAESTAAGEDSAAEQSEPTAETSPTDDQATTATESEPTGDGPDTTAAESERTDDGSDTATAESAADSTPAETGEASDSVSAETDKATDSTAAETGEAPEPTPAETGESRAAGDTPASTDDGGESDIGDFDPEEFELESETREQIEEEYGTEFQTGTEVDEPGAADIETPTEPEEAQEEGDQPAGTEEPQQGADDAEQGVEDAEQAGEGEPEQVDEGAQATEETGQAAEGGRKDEGESGAPASEQATEEPDDVQSAVVDLMGELDDGDGADREALIAEMDERYGVARDAVEDAIQDALMDGQCYEPDDDSLKPI